MIMKKLLILLFCINSLMINAQWKRYTEYQQDSLVTPIGTDTSNVFVFYSQRPWSIFFEYEELDDVDATLGVYTYDETSGKEELLWVDQNIDGTNDNPFTLSDSTMYLWGDNYPFGKMKLKLTKGSVTAGLPVRYYMSRAKKLEL